MTQLGIIYIVMIISLLGHKSIETTQQYTQIATNRLFAGMQATASYIKALTVSQDSASGDVTTFNNLKSVKSVVPNVFYWSEASPR